MPRSATYVRLEAVHKSEESSEDVERSSNARLAIASSTLWALQLVWSTIFARGTSYLTTIGIPMSLSALLWISGPLSGLIVQPLLGAISDSYDPGPDRNKRKPFILAGAIATAACMTGLAWTPNIMVLLVAFCGQEYETALLIANAFVWLWGLSISVQPLQGGIRTLLFEICLKRGQAQFAAWQGVLVAFGTVCGYALASLQIGGTPASAWSEIKRFQNLSMVVAGAVLLCSAITIICPYRTPNENSSPSAASVRYSVSLSSAMKRNLACLRSLPRSIQLTLQVQFFSWMGWFPALYYQTAYFAGLNESTEQYGREPFPGRAHQAEQAAFDSLPFTLVMLTTSIILALTSQWSGSSSRHAEATSSKRSLTLLVDLWLAGHVLFTITMALSIFITGKTEGVWIIALVGIPRALSNWVPFALIGREVTGSHDAGTLTSLHNAALSAPQILAAGLCSLLFVGVKYLGSHDEARWAMLLACLAGLAASWRSLSLRTEIRT